MQLRAVLVLFVLLDANVKFLGHRALLKDELRLPLARRWLVRHLLGCVLLGA